MDSILRRAFQNVCSRVNLSFLSSPDCEVTKRLGSDSMKLLTLMTGPAPTILVYRAVHVVSLCVTLISKYARTLTHLAIKLAYYCVV